MNTNKGNYSVFTGFLLYRSFSWAGIFDGVNIMESRSFKNKHTYSRFLLPTEKCTLPSRSDVNKAQTPWAEFWLDVGCHSAACLNPCAVHLLKALARHPWHRFYLYYFTAYKIRRWFKKSIYSWDSQYHFKLVSRGKEFFLKKNNSNEKPPLEYV